jgi:two-component system, cell cycle sensor histidine kinase and response regulator CckA
LDVGTKLLRTLGYKVFATQSGKEAIEIYKRSQEDIDIVILDMIMPEMSGGELFDRLKAVNPGVKCLLSSGYSITGEATEILDRGCRGFVQKPYNISELSIKLREISKKEYS